MSRDASPAVVVAIDGPAGAGKSSVARRLAAALGFAYLDTGAMYRAVTWTALERKVALDDGAALAALARGLDLTLSSDGRVSLAGRDVTAFLRSEAVNAGVSLVAAVPQVRAVMQGHQRRFARENGRVVAEGRDMGTVVFPDAPVKVFLDARPQERARRRMAETSTADPGGGPSLQAVEAGLERRDRLDRTRAVAPLTQAPDAWVLDTTDLTLDQVVTRVLAQVQSALRLGSGR